MSKVLRIADSAGVVGAVFAALCCAGAPLILSVLAAVGLSFLRTDAILLPLMVLSLVIALWGFWTARRLHSVNAPLFLAVAGSVALAVGVVFVHGHPAKVLIGVGAVALVVATSWNVWLKRTCASPNSDQPSRHPAQP